MDSKKISKVSDSFPGIEDFLNNSVFGSNDASDVKRTPKNVKAAADKLQELARKFRQEWIELQDAYIEYQQEWIIAEPTVYVARTKDVKNDHEYFTAKTFWPTKDGKRKEIKIYLGKAGEFGNNTMNYKAKEFAKNKMSETLRRRKDMGEI